MQTFCFCTSELADGTQAGVRINPLRHKSKIKTCKCLETSASLVWRCTAEGERTQAPGASCLVQSATFLKEVCTSSYGPQKPLWKQPTMGSSCCRSALIHAEREDCTGNCGPQRLQTEPNSLSQMLTHGQGSNVQINHQPQAVRNYPCYNSPSSFCEAEDSITSFQNGLRVAEGPRLTMGHGRCLLQVTKIYCPSEKCLPRDVFTELLVLPSPLVLQDRSELWKPLKNFLMPIPEMPLAGQNSSSYFGLLSHRAAAGILCCNQLIVCSALRAAFYTWDAWMLP